ncbi:MAG: hypothetical protein WKI04_10675 [Ferruginibacter sp.]
MEFNLPVNLMPFNGRCASTGNWWEPGFAFIDFFANLMDKLKVGSASLQASEYILNAVNEKGLFVLLADDDSDDRELFEEAITEINSSIKVSTVVDGFQLINVLHASFPFT